MRGDPKEAVCFSEVSDLVSIFVFGVLGGGRLHILFVHAEVFFVTIPEAVPIVFCVSLLSSFPEDELTSSGDLVAASGLSIHGAMFP
jgi:hypothetical protein